MEAAGNIGGLLEAAGDVGDLPEVASEVGDLPEAEICGLREAGAEIEAA